MSLVWIALGAFGYSMVSDKKSRTSAKAQHALVEDTGIAVVASCDEWEVTDPIRAKLLFQQIYIEERLDGVTAPGEIAGALMARFYPRCQTFDKVRTVGELDFYSMFFEDALDQLYADGVITQDAYSVEMLNFEAWYITQAGGLIDA